MSNAKLKAQSAAMLRDSKQREAAYITTMRKTESQMTPVLKSFQDQVLFLKHNLNARAIGKALIIPCRKPTSSSLHSTQPTPIPTDSFS